MTERNILIAVILGLSLLACSPKTADVKVDQVRLNGISLGMTLAEVEAKLGKGQQLIDGDRPVYDYKSLTVSLNKEGKVSGVDGNSEMGELVLEVNGTEFKSMPSGQMLGPSFGQPRVEHQMTGSSYTYRTPSIGLGLSADGRGHWGATFYSVAAEGQ